jgi:hypothetical protein
MSEVSNPEDVDPSSQMNGHAHNEKVSTSKINENGTSKSHGKMSKNESGEVLPFELISKAEEKKMTDQEVLLLENRIKRMELEEQRARKRIAEAKAKTESMLNAK